MSFNTKTLILCACVLAAVVISGDTTINYNFQSNTNMKLTPSSDTTNTFASCAFNSTVTLTPVWVTANNVTNFNTLTAAGTYNQTLAGCKDLNLNYTLTDSAGAAVSYNSTIDLMSAYLTPANAGAAARKGLLKSITSQISNQSMTTSVVTVQLPVLTPGNSTATPIIPDTYAVQQFNIDFTGSSTSGSKLSALFGLIALISLLAF